ncbi:hypothetical protein DLR65_11260 [Vibrio tarriae]|uniref:hypothetical protein n=1 Tax=Vibrio tarriae TaxID=2014742 RepID=UPI000DE30217|nr:hypothetical protein [Vibrio tarriae]QEO43860.1 DUF2057 domain-containing protein [Vibrio cholerae]RBM27591.1 hypothetical protein DLR59_08405 [Vibrio tarriae]RBM31249.1 hypothetical protein DLR58_16130 [Vibrio tarriae]RBM48816.1 hypothetical protein DLR65_11260 [Vibrio tarriae]
MMNLFKTTILFSTITMAVGCSNLDSSSVFNDVAKNVKERHNYVQVVAKDITPEAKAILGPDIVKSELSYVGNFPKAEGLNIEGSYVDMNVTYFKNYDQFDTVSYSSEQFKVDTYRPLAETCTEHCTSTQWFKFPLSQEYIQQLNSDSVVFALTSSTGKNQVEFTVPKAYFLAVINEAKFALQGATVTPVAPIVAVQTQPTASKPTEMVQYLFGEANSAERQEFANWAFANRAEVAQPMVTQNKLVEMMADWYKKADKAEKASILSWLISQE